MKHLILLFLPLLGNAQAKDLPTEVCAYYFDYDAGGNRVKRYYKCSEVQIDDPAPKDPKEPIHVLHQRQGRDTGGSLPSTFFPDPSDFQNSEGRENTDLTPTISPNPTSGIATIQWEGRSDAATVMVMDASGKMVYQGNFGFGQIDLTSQPAGVYFLLLRSGDTMHQLSLVKE